MSIAIYKNGPSNGAVALGQALGATILKTTGSSYRGKPNKLLINWGSSQDEARRLAGLTNSDNLLNAPAAVALASNKLHCLTRLSEADVPVVPWYTNLEDALNHGGRIYARTRLTGSSGEGIRMIMSANDPQLGERRDLPFPVDIIGLDLIGSTYRNTQLFTVGITGKRQEWRVHVVKGQAILTQLKLRRQGSIDTEGYTSLVRNIQTGWVYGVNYDANDYPQIATVQAVAQRAVEALGLDFGAVDIVEKRGEPFVLEVNTAPGLEEEGSALTSYVTAFHAIHDEILRNRSARA